MGWGQANEPRVVRKIEQTCTWDLRMNRFRVRCSDLHCVVSEAQGALCGIVPGTNQSFNTKGKVDLIVGSIIGGRLVSAFFWILCCGGSPSFPGHFQSGHLVALVSSCSTG